MGQSLMFSLAQEQKGILQPALKKILGGPPLLTDNADEKPLQQKNGKKENGGQDASGPNSRETLSQCLEQLFAVSEC